MRKRHIFNQYLPFYTVANNRLIYKHSNKSFLISDLNKGFNKPQELLRPRLASLNEPHLQGNKLVYMEGDVYRKSIYQLESEKPIKLSTNGFVPQVLANYNNQLVFTAKATNITQVYLLNHKNKATQISKMVVDEKIHHLEIVGDIFVLSYANKVAIYQYKNQKLTQVKTITGFNRGVIDKSGKYLLLSHSNGNEANNIVEKRLNDLTPTGKKLSEVKFAFYHQGEIIYLDKDNELFRLTANGPITIATKIAVEMFEHISIDGDDLYYFALKSVSEHPSTICHFEMI